MQITELSANRVTKLDNATCIYCGKEFGTELSKTEEHVIGKRFVPRGLLEAQWNLIANACEQCNSAKSGLEDDISIITMMSGGVTNADVVRKAAGSRSRRTGKRVADSEEHRTLRGTLASVDFTFGVTAPAQVDETRLFRLVCYHLGAFFYFLTYDNKTLRGGFLPGIAFPLAVARRSDWGSRTLRHFTDLIRNWDLRFQTQTANGHFKFHIRRCPGDAPLWSWAAEWNRGLRIVGFAGDQTTAQNLVEQMPTEPMQLLSRSRDRQLRFRPEVPLTESEDRLFDFSTCN